MRKFAAAILFSPAIAYAAPFLVADVDPQTTQCGVLLDTAAKVTVNAQTINGARVCRHDLASVTSGAHTARMTAMANDPVWGPLESAPSAPFGFSRPVAPGTPSGSRLEP